ncbi:ParB/RepB/Spo0J family partition protein [Streptomyces sp. NPDC052013]|uniref:ParB/RepB/Spo0J family partition protein n=1 Tax=Streptomyces sp. NPDC052013 TaxID=3365679 RepID=UPI0037D388E0
MATAVSTPPTEPGTHEEEAPQIVLLDPALVVRDECNAREEDIEPDEDLINSVKEIGVEEPISVRPRPNGTFGVFKGWRRAQAQQIANSTAEQDGRPVRRIKAHVREDLIGRDGWTRFLSLVENKHREGMSERDILKSQELSLIDMSDVERRQASRALGVSRNAAKQAKAAQRLDDATLRRAAAGGMDLEQTAQLAEVASVPGASAVCCGRSSATRTRATAGAATGTRRWRCSRPNRPMPPPGPRPRKTSRRRASCCSGGPRTVRRTRPGR